MPTKKKNSNELTLDIITKYNEENLSVKTDFIEKLAEVNKEKIFKTFEEQPNIEYLVCYPKRHVSKFYTNMVNIKTFTIKNRMIFLTVKDILEELNNGIYIYVERNGGDMVIRDNYGVIVEV